MNALTLKSLTHLKNLLFSLNVRFHSVGQQQLHDPTNQSELGLENAWYEGASGTLGKGSSPIGGLSLEQTSQGTKPARIQGVSEGWSQSYSLVLGSTMRNREVDSMILMDPIQLEIVYGSMILYQTINKQGLPSSSRSTRNFKNGKWVNEVMEHMFI